ncbi:MAG: hypothetical protein L3K19_02995 [Thermoplasmata archaeon]|nr:hypothetical protein [Thermoplasmata archaeon]
MRARKVVNRVYQGRTYYRWLLSIAPKDVQRLGWVDGQALKSYVRGSTLTIEPGVAGGPVRRATRSSDLEGSVRRRSLGPRQDPAAPSRIRE